MADTLTRDSGPRVLGGRYEVGELIGRGGMAEVHIGHDTRLGRTVAIKILRSDLARDPAFQARFQREAQSAASLNYPAIVAVYDSGEDTYPDPTTGEIVHVPYIVMEYVEGHTVREILNHGDAVPIDEAVEITSGVLSALDYSHHAGIIHRDIKPGNVMITPTGSVKVMDFGIARAVADSAATMTQTQAVIGTAQYLSPEQARGETVDARSDIYSTGCLLFELLTGRPPFVGDSPVAVAYQHVGQAPLAPSDLAADVPPELDRITLKALAKERSQRYSSAAEFRADLDAFLAGQTTSVTHSAPHVVAPGVGATQVFHPGIPATQVFHPGIHGGVGETQHIGAVAGPVAAGVGATAVYHGQGFPGAVPPVAESVLPGSHTPVPQWGPLAQTGPATPGHGIEQVHEEPPKPKIWLWVLLPLLIIGVGLAAFFLLRGSGEPTEEPPATVSVPTFTEGVTQAEACAALDELDLLCDPQFDDDSNAPIGTFLRQSPLGGTELEVGQPVTLWFSGGPATVAVPNMEGMTVDQATAALEALGLKVGDITSEPHNNIPEGLVIRSYPAVTVAVTRGDTIGLYISTGWVDLPNLVGRTQDQAVAQLNELGLRHEIRPEQTTAQPPGTVVRQSPNPGQMEQGGQVALYVAVAPEVQMLTVPNIVGQNWAAVAGQLEGFNVTVIEADSLTQYAGAVISTSPAGGTELAAGSTVTVQVSRGPGPQAPPATTPCPYDPPGPSVPNTDPSCVAPAGRSNRADRSGLARLGDSTTLNESDLDGPDFEEVIAGNLVGIAPKAQITTPGTK